MPALQNSLLIFLQLGLFLASWSMGKYNVMAKLLSNHSIEEVIKEILLPEVQSEEDSYDDPHWCEISYSSSHNIDFVDAPFVYFLQ
jgi:hypothetical protein